MRDFVAELAFYTTQNKHKRRTSMFSGGSKPITPVIERSQTYALGYGYNGARNDTTQQSGQTPDKELEIKKQYFLCQRLH